MQLDLAHLEGCGVVVPHQISNQATILVDLLGSLAVGHPGRLHDGSVRTHVVDQSDEAVIEDPKGNSQNFVQRWNVEALDLAAAIHEGR